MPALSHAPFRIVQSRQNARVKQLRAALARPSPQLIGLEGLHLIEEALRSRVKVLTLFVRAGAEAMLPALGETLSLVPEILVLSDDLFRSALTTESPQPLAALAVPPSFTASQAFADPGVRTPLLLILAALQDPGNVGAILRSAEAFGATGILALPGTANPWNPKSLRASMGSAFRLPVLPMSIDQALHALQSRAIRSLATVATMHTLVPAIDAVDLTVPIALWIGSEGSGLTSAEVEHCDGQVTVPCPGPVESLNAAVAAGVLLYEASRQRSLSHAHWKPS